MGCSTGGCSRPNHPSCSTHPCLQLAQAHGVQNAGPGCWPWWGASPPCFGMAVCTHTGLARISPACAGTPQGHCPGPGHVMACPQQQFGGIPACVCHADTMLLTAPCLPWLGTNTAPCLRAPGERRMGTLELHNVGQACRSTGEGSQHACTMLTSFPHFWSAAMSCHGNTGSCLEPGLVGWFGLL